MTLGDMAAKYPTRELCRVRGGSIEFVGERYSIELSRCDTHASILEWVAHLCEKNWVTTETVRQFAETACKAHGLKLWGGA